MIKAGIIGATGYAGNELVRILVNHPEAEIVWLGSKSYEGQPYSDIFKNMRGITDDICLGDDFEKLSEMADVIFTATPQGYLQGLFAGGMAEKILSRTKVIDLSADFRLKNKDIYEKWYGLEHKSFELTDEAVYGLCEINRGLMNKDTRLVANPGCYTTASILALYPLVKEGLIDTDTIVTDAKSGTSGAGRSAKTDNLFCEVNESIKAYAVSTHRHTPEIEEQLGYACGSEVVMNFTPHLVPMQRGILTTSYAKLKGNVSAADINAAFEKQYKDEYFIRLLCEGVLPETRFVKCSNFADIGFVVDERTKRVIVVSAIDNLIKGAAGQAVQNMNILFGLDEKTGLETVPVVI